MPIRNLSVNYRTYRFLPVCCGNLHSVVFDVIDLSCGEIFLDRAMYYRNFQLASNFGEGDTYMRRAHVHSHWKLVVIHSAFRLALIQKLDIKFEFTNNTQRKWTPHYETLCSRVTVLRWQHI